MFKLELLELLKRFKSADKYEKEKILKSIHDLIQQNEKEFENFRAESGLSSEHEEVIEKAKNLSEEEEEREESNDYKKIRKAFENWSKDFESNNFTPSEKGSKIVADLVSFYAPNRFNILKGVLEVKGDDNYEKFQNMIRNYLRLYYLNIIKQYTKSERFQSLKGFSRWKKKNHLHQLYDDLGKYKFNPEKIQEVMR